MSFKVFNLSSEKMPEVQDDTVDLILAGPPYNIGTTYSKNPDDRDAEDFQKMLTKIIKECYRVSKEGAYFVVECSDTVFNQDSYTLLCALIAKSASLAGFKLIERHVSYTQTKEGMELAPDSHWPENFSTREGAHSNCHQIMVFRKSANDAFNQELGKILYYQYPENEEGHPCPFSPALIDFVLSRYYKEGDTVLDPFMGTGRLGREVLKRGGTFIGFELEKEFFTTAEKMLEECDQ